MTDKWINKPHPVLMGGAIYGLSREADTITTLLAMKHGATESYTVGGPLSPVSMYEHYGIGGLIAEDIAGLAVMTLASGLIELGQQRYENRAGRRSKIRGGFVAPLLMGIPGFLAAAHNMSFVR